MVVDGVPGQRTEWLHARLSSAQVSLPPPNPPTLDFGVGRREGMQYGEPGVTSRDVGPSN